MSKIEKLINAGNEIAEKNQEEGLYGAKFISGVDYEKWISDVVFFMHDNKESFPEFLYERVIESAKVAVGNGTEHFERIIGVLNSAKEREEIQA